MFDWTLVGQWYQIETSFTKGTECQENPGQSKVLAAAGSARLLDTSAIGTCLQEAGQLRPFVGSEHDVAIMFEFRWGLRRFLPLAIVDRKMIFVSIL